MKVTKEIPEVKVTKEKPKGKKYLTTEVKEIKEKPELHGN